VSTTSDEVLADLIIRPLSFGDIPAIMQIEREAFAMPWRSATFEGLMGRLDSDILGASRLGRLVGYCACWTIGDQAELGNVAVTASERGRGTGRRLVEAALERIAEREALECFLEVRESNASARTLYESCGFNFVGRRRNYYTKPIEDALVMRMRLT
jgi:ribosomal-protein-alanine N-acetyltransferase